jgi:SAM-dependent methyltransferase
MREPIPRSTFDQWRAQGGGWSPLFSEPMLRLALEHLEPALGPGRTVLDLGAAAGHMTALFHARGARAVALDVNAEALAEGRAPYPGPERLAADQARLPLRSASVDALFAFSSIQYSSERAAVLAECRRVLKPGGRIAVVENLAGNPFARFGRLLRAALRSPYPPHLAPRAHLRWTEREIYERHFREVAFDAFHLLTPMLLASGAMAHAPAAGGGPRGAYGLLSRWDARLLRWWPGAAWCVVVRGVR